MTPLIAAGRDLQLQAVTYPAPAAVQRELIELWRTAWTRGDYDWPEALHGDYSDRLTMTSIIARRGAEAVATATICYARCRPEVALMSSVVTHPAWRGRGYATRVVEAALQAASSAGCAVCYLGTQAQERNVYARCGFEWATGQIMRRFLTPRGQRSEAQRYRPSRSTRLRLAHWGDMPGLALLTFQPLTTAVLDFPRGIINSALTQTQRCASCFPVLWRDITDHGGQLIILADVDDDRVLGFASFTPGPGPARRHVAVIDLVAHDCYQDRLADQLLDVLTRAKHAGVTLTQAYIARTDQDKLRVLKDAGFVSVADLPDAIQTPLGPLSVHLMQRRINRWPTA